jgi:hypothetical protein
MTLKTIAFAAIAAALLATAATAEDFVKPAPTPMPAAGPTVVNAQQFCGDPSGKAEELIARYTTQKGLKETYKSVDYIAYSDDEKNPTVMYTFTVKGQAAHPSIVCRKQVKEGEFLVVKMQVVCDSTTEACDKLRNDFNVINAQAQTEVENKIKDAEKK